MSDDLKKLSRGPRPIFGKADEFDREKIISAFHSAFQMIGGQTRLALWANENPGEFYKLYAKLFPSTSAAIGEGNTMVVTVNIPPTALDRHPGYDSRVIEVDECPERLN